MTKEKDFLFDVQTPIGFSVRVSRSWWQTIVTVKHPVMRGHEDEVRLVLEKPDEIRISRIDLKVYLFYGRGVVSDGFAQ